MNKLLLLSFALLAYCLSSSAMASYYQWFRIINQMNEAITFQTKESCFEYNLTGYVPKNSYHEYQTTASEDILSGCSRTLKIMTFYFYEAGKTKPFFELRAICAPNGNSNPTCTYDPNSAGNIGSPNAKANVTSSGRYFHMTLSPT